MPGTVDNVVVFFTDQQRWDTVGLAGCPLDLTPNFDYWASRGTYLPYATTPQPVCGPARACLQTGRYATAIGDGCHTNGRPLPVEADTLAKRFNDGGRSTGYFGKWHLGTEQAVPEAERGGWQTWLANNASESNSDGYHALVHDEQQRPVKLPGYRVDALTDATIRFIDGCHGRGERFCCMVSHLEPHMQNHRDAHPAPFGYEERYRGRWTPPDLACLPGADPFYEHMVGGNAQQSLPGYLGSIKRLDEAFGRLMDALASLDLLESTAVVFTSDHGCHFRTRNSEYKRSCHDVSLRVPTMFFGGPFTGGGRDERPFQLTDLAPTLCDAAGLDAPDGAQGHSLLGDMPSEAFSQISESQFGRCVRTKRWKYAAVSPDIDSKDRYSTLLVESHLYDLVADPYELVNLAGSAVYRPICDEMKATLLRRMSEAGEPDATIENAPQPDPKPGQLFQRELRPEDDLLPPTV
ncbi:MAG: sulfatase-like hydrolase/transferase [Planctomycetota bacterium]